jgi:hypothetical protein
MEFIEAALFVLEPANLVNTIYPGARMSSLYQQDEVAGGAPHTVQIPRELGEITFGVQ